MGEAVRKAKASTTMTNPIDFNVVLKDGRGKPFEEVVADRAGAPKIGDDGEIEVRELTLGDIVTRALNSQLPPSEGQQPKSEDAETVFRRGRLAYRIAESMEKGEPIAVSASDVTKIKDRLAKIFVNAGMIYVAHMMLDPASGE